MYRLGLYLPYCFYPPLYIAGPTITYNNFVSQLAAPPRITAGQVLRYTLRWFGAVAVLELMTHTLYFNATAKYKLLASGVLQGQGMAGDPLHYTLTGFWVLIFMWLKVCVALHNACLSAIWPPSQAGTRCHNSRPMYRCHCVCSS